MSTPRRRKIIVIIAGPNGAGKTTFAESLLGDEPSSPDFINADLIARGLSPLAPEKMSIAAGRAMVREIRAKVANGESFAFETTLSGLIYARHIREWRRKGYRIRLIFLKLPIADTAITRVRYRVIQGGHGVPEHVIRRRFALGWSNFERVYRDLVDDWAIYDCSGKTPVLEERKR